MVCCLGWLGACQPQPKAPVLAPQSDAPTPRFARGTLCERHPDRCELSCAACPDREQCRKSGGECVGAGVPTYLDEIDKGDDPLHAGCHYAYDNNCTVNKRFHTGDECITDDDDKSIKLEEWTNGTCHPPQGDYVRHDCDEVCKAANPNTPFGTCVPKPNFCGTGQHSAQCECSAPQQPN
jgi:hypothetical protein